MPALTFKGKYVNISYADDTLTFYPTFAYYENDTEHKFRNCLNVVKACGNLNFVIKRLDDKKSTQENEQFISALESINSKKSAGSCLYDKFVMRCDDDHMLYHRENNADQSVFKLDASHWHIKFNLILNQEQMNDVLNIFISNGLLAVEEKNTFITAVNYRYSQNHEQLTALLSNEKETDTNKILTFITTCQDNDVLVNLHHYLTTEKFDYLREISDEKIAYQGTNRNGQIVKTSKTWAQIEKAFTLQISHNIQTQCTQFTSELGKTYATRLDNQYTFFAIKRKAKHGPTAKSKTYEAMTNADENILNQKYEKAFVTESGSLPTFTTKRQS